MLTKSTTDRRPPIDDNHTKATSLRTTLEEYQAYSLYYYYKRKQKKEEPVKSDPWFLRNDQETDEQQGRRLLENGKYDRLRA